MAYSIGLTLYNLAARRVSRGVVERPARPAGALVWLHAAGADTLGALQELARQLVMDDGVSVVMTVPDGHAGAVSAARIQPPPDDTMPDVQDFLDHWRPDLIVMSGGELRPALLHEADHRRLPLLMVEARSPVYIPGREGWFPGLIGTCLAAFRQIFVLDEAAGRAFAKAGAQPGQLVVAGRMEEASAALPYIEADRAALAQILATRPIWLAAGVHVDEEDAVIAAHRDALGQSHRLLLILVPQDPDRAIALAAKVEAQEGWRVALRHADPDLDHLPDSETEVYIPDQPGEYGLWYRLAPVTFLGGSLGGDGCHRNPMEPAALGSAILYGPQSGPHGVAYGRLGAARAARMVASAGDLAQALGDLLSPDRAARQAQAAWAVASEGAEVTHRVMTAIRAIMDGA